MSTFDLDCRATFGALIAAIEEAGGTITWTGAQPSNHNQLTIEVEVDAEEAFERIPSRWYEREEQALSPEPRDVSDFVEACLGGDRHLAVALLPRVVGPDGAQDAAERALRMSGRA